MTSRTDMNSNDTLSSGRMLGPSAYSESLLPSLRLARSSRYARTIGKILLVSLVVGFGFVAVAPWQQSVTGKGSVIAFDPTERPQTIEATAKGRVVKWGPKVEPNAHVKKGDLIAEIQDIDPNFMVQLSLQVQTAKDKVDALKARRDASMQNKEAKESVVISQEALLKTYQSAKNQILASADAAIAGAENKVVAEQRQLEEVEAALVQIKADYERQKQLFEEQAAPQVKFQLAERKYKEGQAKVKKAEAYVESARYYLVEKEADRNAKEQKADGDIAYARSQVDKAIGEVQKAESDVQKATSELNEAQKMLSEIEVKRAQQQAQRVEAPFDGFLTSITANQGAIMVKVGDPLCVIVPDTQDRAVEIMLEGNDAPLVSPGRHVRLQFEGWPAVQFAGWPSVAVGTFGGKIVSVNANDNGKGKFIAYVRPDDERHGWPNERFLRQGVRTNAWVLLERVPLWYEIWRNMNGFPPVVTDIGDGTEKPKKPKLPK
jgi:multidrug resistance efflux pump